MEALNITLIQTDLAWENKEANLMAFEALFPDVPPATDLVVLPEMFSTGFTMNPEPVAEPMNGNTVQWMIRMAEEHKVAVAGSVVVREDEVFRNRFLFVHPDGKVDHYDKRHSFTLAGEHEKYTRGERRVLIDFKGWKIFPQICYDLRFPVFSRNDQNYDLLIYVANWPEKRIQAWDTLLKARAIENMSYCIGVNRTGIDGNDYKYPGHSAVFDPLGDRLCYSEDVEMISAVLLPGKIRNTRQRLGFLNDRDEFTLDLK